MKRPNLTFPLEIKSLTKREFEGYGSVFGNTDLGGDVVVKGAFDSSIAEWKGKGEMPQMFWMHDPSRVPGKWLDMSEDDNGLYVKGELADTPLGNEIHTLLKMDAVRGLSIGYQTVEADWGADDTRLIKQVKLWEVSAVSLPMNPLAQVEHVKTQLSAAGEYVPTAREFERTLRDVGCSQRVAKVILSKLYDGEVRDAPAIDDDEVRDVLAGVEKLLESQQAAQLQRIFTKRDNHV